MPWGFLSFSCYLVVSVDVFLSLFDAYLSNYDIHLVTFVPRGVTLFPHLSPQLTFSLILPTLTQSAHISKVSFFLSRLICSASGLLSLCLVCSRLLFSLHLYVQCPFLSLLFISALPGYSMPPLRFSLLPYSDSPCPPSLFLSPSIWCSHLPFYFPLIYLISLCLYPPLSLTHTASQRWLRKPCDHFLPINLGGLTALPELTVEKQMNKCFINAISVFPSRMWHRQST